MRGEDDGDGDDDAGGDKTPLAASSGATTVEKQRNRETEIK